MARIAKKPAALSLTPLEAELLRDFMEEIDALIDADDGTLFNMRLIEKFEEIQEIIC